MTLDFTSSLSTLDVTNTLEWKFWQRFAEGAHKSYLSLSRFVELTVYFRYFPIVGALVDLRAEVVVLWLPTFHRATSNKHFYSRL